MEIVWETAILEQTLPKLKDPGFPDSILPQLFQKVSFRNGIGPLREPKCSLNLNAFTNQRSS